MRGEEDPSVASPSLYDARTFSDRPRAESHWHSPALENVSLLSQNVRLKQMKMLNKFMARSFVTGLLLRFKDLLEADPSRELSRNDQEATPSHRTTNKRDSLCTFLEVLMSRTKATKLQFKQMCVICIKFLSSCSAQNNFMAHLKFDLRKLMLASLAFTYGNRLTHTFEVFAKCSGLQEEEINNCCSVVRKVLNRRPYGRRWQNAPSQVDSNPLSSLYSRIDEKRVNFGISVDHRSHYGFDDKDGQCYGYVLPGELEQFNNMSRDLICEHFMIG